MKKSLLVISVVLLIAGLFISCNSEAAESSNELTYVKFVDEGKGLGSSITTWEDPGAPAVNSLKWYYKASKASGAQVGAKSTWTAVNNTNGLGGTIGPFSVGNWKFELIGCNPATAPTSSTVLNDGTWTVEETVMYAGVSGSSSYTSPASVQLKRGTTPTTIPVAVARFNVETAPNKIDLTYDVNYGVEGTGKLYYKVSINGTKVAALCNEATITNDAISIVKSAAYEYSFSGPDFTAVTVKFEVYDEAPVDGVYNDEVKLAEGSVSFPGLKGSSVSITGTLEDLDYAYGEFGTPTDLTPETPATTLEAYILRDNTYTPYTSFTTAIADAQNGDTVGLLEDVNLTSGLTISKSITLEGNSHKITSSVAGSTAITFYFGGAYYNKQNTAFDNPFTVDLGVELAKPVVRNLSVVASNAQYGIVFEGFVDALIENTDITCDVNVGGCGVTIAGFNDTTNKTSMYQSFLTAKNVRTNSSSSFSESWKNAAISSQMYGVLTIEGASSSSNGLRAIGSYSSPSKTIVSDGSFTGSVVAMATTDPYKSSKYYDYDFENHKYVLVSTGEKHNIIEINGGSFTNVTFEEEQISGANIGDIVIKGGTFDANPGAYVPTGYTVTETDGIWTVTNN